MATSQSDTDELELLRAAASGDDAAGQRLLARHRGRLRQMVAVYLDRRLAARVDPSDVVQEALADAARGSPTTCGSGPCRSTPGSGSSPGSGCCSCTATTSGPDAAASIARSPGTWPCPISRPMPWPIA